MPFDFVFWSIEIQQRSKGYPETLQRLIGYDLGGPYLGFVEQGNPLRLLEDPITEDYARTEPALNKKNEKIKPIVFGDMQAE